MGKSRGHKHQAGMARSTATANEGMEGSTDMRLNDLNGSKITVNRIKSPVYKVDTVLKAIPSVLASLFSMGAFAAGGGWMPAPVAAALLFSLALGLYAYNKLVPRGDISRKLSVELEAETKDLFDETQVTAIDYESPEPGTPSFAVKRFFGHYLVFVPAEVKAKFDYTEAKTRILGVVVEELAAVKAKSSRSKSWANDWNT